MTEPEAEEKSKRGESLFYLMRALLSQRVIAHVLLAAALAIGAQLWFYNAADDACVLASS